MAWTKKKRGAFGHRQLCLMSKEKSFSDRMETAADRWQPKSFHCWSRTQSTLSIFVGLFVSYYQHKQQSTVWITHSNNRFSFTWVSFEIHCHKRPYMRPRNFSILIDSFDRFCLRWNWKCWIPCTLLIYYDKRGEPHAHLSTKSMCELVTLRATRKCECFTIVARDNHANGWARRVNIAIKFAHFSGLMNEVRSSRRKHEIKSEALTKFIQCNDRSTD